MVRRQFQYLVASAAALFTLGLAGSAQAQQNLGDLLKQQDRSGLGGKAYDALKQGQAKKKSDQQKQDALKAAQNQLYADFIAKMPTSDDPLQKGEFVVGFTSGAVSGMAAPQAKTETLDPLKNVTPITDGIYAATYAARVFGMTSDKEKQKWLNASSAVGVLARGAQSTGFFTKHKNVQPLDYRGEFVVQTLAGRLFDDAVNNKTLTAVERQKVLFGLAMLPAIAQQAAFAQSNSAKIVNVSVIGDQNVRLERFMLDANRVAKELNAVFAKPNATIADLKAFVSSMADDAGLQLTMLDTLNMLKSVLDGEKSDKVIGGSNLAAVAQPTQSILAPPLRLG